MSVCTWLGDVRARQYIQHSRIRLDASQGKISNEASLSVNFLAMKMKEENMTVLAGSSSH